MMESAMLVLILVLAGLLVYCTFSRKNKEEVDLGETPFKMPKPVKPKTPKKPRKKRKYTRRKQKK